MGIRAFVIFVGFALLAGCGRKQPAPSPASELVIVPAVLAGAAQPRPVLPYSVIPGGVRSTEELRTSIQTDTVVAAHYAGVDVKALKPVTLQRDTAAYVSFRMDGKVYWTSRKVRLAAGEKIWEGREVSVRGRCGNQISGKPRTPVLKESKLEPSGETLSTPVTPAPASSNESARTAAPARIPVDAFASDRDTVVSTPQPSSLGWSTFGAVPVGGGGGGGVIAMGGGGGGGGGAAGTGSSAAPAPANSSSAPVLSLTQSPISSVAPAFFAVYAGSTAINSFPAAPYAPVISIPLPWIAPHPSIVSVQLPPPAVVYPPVWTYATTGTPAAPPPPDTLSSLAPKPPVVSSEPLIPQNPIPAKLTPPPGAPAETPEPATWVTLMAGLGIVGIKKLRR